MARRRPEGAAPVTGGQRQPLQPRPGKRQAATEPGACRRSPGDGRPRPMSTQQVASSELRVASNDDTQHAPRNTQHLLAFGLYALLSIVVTWPMAATLGTKAIGTPELYSDRAQ